MVSIISVLFSATINLTVLFFKVGMLLYRLKIKSFLAPQKEKKKKRKKAHICTAITCFSFYIFGGIESENNMPVSFSVGDILISPD